MSVAFRRESDEEHLEPKFELPIPPGPNLVTARGLARIQAKVAELEALLPGVPDEAERKALRRDLRYWRTRLATAQLAPVPPSNDISVLHCGVICGPYKIYNKSMLCLLCACLLLRQRPLRRVPQKSTRIGLSLLKSYS